VGQVSSDRAQPGGRWPLGWVAGFVIALAGVWFTFAFGREIGDWWQSASATLTTPDDFRAWVESLGAWGPLAFFFAQALQVIIVPIPGTLFPPVGALAFGPWPALGLSLAGMALGSAVVFLAARRWGRPLAVRLVGEEPIHRYESLMTARGGLLIWLVFVIPLLPDDALCALAGLSGIPLRRFMVIATVGRVPAVAAGVFTMAGLEGAPAWVWIAATLAGGIALWVGLRYRDVLERRLLGAMRRKSPSPAERSATGALATTAVDTSDSPPVMVDTMTTTPTRDPLVSVLSVVVLTTSIAVLVGVVAGVSGLASGLILIWGVVLAVIVAWARDDE
jgi:uncharacterized membrane protein YdjX (TVP38/TMEM64 family)